MIKEINYLLWGVIKGKNRLILLQHFFIFFMYHTHLITYVSIPQVSVQAHGPLVFSIDD